MQGEETIEKEEGMNEPEGQEKDRKEPEMQEDRNESEGQDDPGEPEDMDGTKGQEGDESSQKDEEMSDELKKQKEKGLFKGKKDKKQSQIEELNDKMMRTMAEFENFRKRSEKEKSGMFDMGAKSVIEKILPVIDNFERGLAAIPEEETDSPFAEGMEMIYKQFVTTLEGIGVKPIEAEGKEFDPNLHNAVMAVEGEQLESNTVCEELQKGYLYKDAVVRHSMVKVVS